MAAVQFLLQILRDGTVLAGADWGATGPDGGLVLGMEVNGQASVDTVSFIRAVTITNFDRFTQSLKLGFAIEIQWDTCTDALNHILTQRSAVPGVADLTLAFLEGTTTTRWKSRGAAWRVISGGEPMGLSTNLKYQVDCPLPLAVTTSATEVFWWDRSLNGGTSARAQNTLYHGGAAGDTHLNTQRRYFGGTAADHS